MNFDTQHSNNIKMEIWWQMAVTSVRYAFCNRWVIVIIGVSISEEDFRPFRGHCVPFKRHIIIE